MPFNLQHKDDIKSTPVSCHVNESKSNNAQGATKQPSPVCSAVWAFNLCMEILKKAGAISHAQPHASLPPAQTEFFGGRRAGEEERSANPCSMTAQILRLQNARAEQNKEICILSDAKQPAAF